MTPFEARICCTRDDVLSRTRYVGGTRVGEMTPAMFIGAGVVGGFLIASLPILWIPIGAGAGYLLTGTGTGALIGAGVGWMLSGAGRG
jgi:hypothetical protein